MLHEERVCYRKGCKLGKKDKGWGIFRIKTKEYS